MSANATIVEAWNTVLFDKFFRFRHLIIDSLAVHSREALARHVPETGARVLDVVCGFGDATLEWETIAPPASRSMEGVLAWLDEAQRLMLEGLASLDDDAQLDDERQAPWRTPMKRRSLIAMISNHDLYHAGEINRQRALLRGAEGWAPEGTST